MRLVFTAVLGAAVLLLAGCSTLRNNGLYMRGTAAAGGAFCGKDYDAAALDLRRICQGMVLVAAAEAGVDRVTHGQTEDAPYMAGLVAAISDAVDRLAEGGSGAFFNADSFNNYRLLGAASVRALHREISFIQLAGAGLTAGVAAASGGSVTVAAAAAGGGWLIPDFIGGPAVRAADFAGKILAIQADAQILISAVKAGTVTPAAAWTGIKQRLVENKARIDPLSRAQ
jgi:hypothetical protein